VDKCINIVYNSIINKQQTTEEEIKMEIRIYKWSIDNASVVQEDGYTRFVLYNIEDNYHAYEITVWDDGEIEYYDVDDDSTNSQEFIIRLWGSTIAEELNKVI